MIPNFIKRSRKFWTHNSVPGIKTKFDNIETFDGVEYREWDPRRSKLAAGIIKRVKLPFKEDSTILYLGASHGYSVSFLSDICKKGIIYALDFAPRVIRDLIYICEKRNNIIPLLADANHPEKYFHKVNLADIIFMDVAQKNQAEIFIKNCNAYLKKEGIGILALKSRSVDITKKSDAIYKQIQKQLEEHFKILEMVKLDPLEKNHALFVVRK